jgi:hypothetical protein
MHTEMLVTTIAGDLLKYQFRLRNVELNFVNFFVNLRRPT